MPSYTRPEHVRFWREQAHLTQEELASRAGVNRRTISDLENRWDRQARPGTMEALAAVLSEALAAHDPPISLSAADFMQQSDEKMLLPLLQTLLERSQRQEARIAALEASVMDLSSLVRQMLSEQV